MKDYRRGLQEIAEGNDKGVARLRQHLTFSEAQSLSTRIGKLASSMTTNPGSGAAARNFRGEMDQLSQARALAKTVSPESEQQLLTLYADVYQAETVSSLTSISAMKYAEANGAYKNWADNFNVINHAQPDGLKLLLGETYEGWVGMASLIRAAHNIDPTAGAINAAGMPFTILRQVMHGSFNTAVHPMAFMFAMKEFAPGGTLWKGMAAGSGYPLSRTTRPGSLHTVEQGAKKFQGKADKAVRKGRSIVNGVLAGRNGAVAAGLASYMGEINYIAPYENDIDLIPIKPEMIQQEEQVMQTQQTQQVSPDTSQLPPHSGYDQAAANLGKSIVDMVTRVNQATVQKVDVEGALAQGKEIATGVGGP